MAVYTTVTADLLDRFLADYDAGAPISFKGIAEGVENSNYLLETTKGRYILTLYEKRVNADNLPYFLALMEHVAAAGVPAARPIANISGDQLTTLAGRPAALIEFLPGLSVTDITTDHAQRAGAALAQFHRATASFTQRRANDLSLNGWQALAAKCADGAESVEAGLGKMISDELAFLATAWPKDLPTGTCHTDLFPDNILFAPDGTPGLIDFYFAADDFYAFDLGVMVNAWCYRSGSFDHALSTALVAGYQSVRPLNDAEKAAFTTLCRGSALRFLLTRLYDWINPVEGAQVTPHDPLIFARILEDQRLKAGFEAYITS